LDKPDVDEIEGLSPAISIDQKSHSHNPRSTVATITEIYDYLRVLFARAGKPHCPKCGKEIKKLTNEEIVDVAIEFAQSLSPEQGAKATSRRQHKNNPSTPHRASTSSAGTGQASSGNKLGRNIVILAPVVRGRKGEYYQMLYDFLNAGFSEVRVDGKYLSLRERIELSRYKAHDIDLVIDRMPAGLNFVDKDNRLRLAEAIEHALKYGNDVVKIIYGDKAASAKASASLAPEGREISLSAKFTCSEDGFSFPEIEPRLFSFNSPYGACPQCHGLGTEDIWSEKICPACAGKRLKEESLSVLLYGKNISSVVAMSVEDAYKFFGSLKLKSENLEAIAETPLREIKSRLKFMLDVGLDYLTLERKAGTLSGGEAQRIRLASQIGSRLVGTLYILDEPTIGLHQKDNAKLIKTLHDLRDLGNTIIVVEHDEETVRESDHLVDIGPQAGVHGGKIVAQGDIPAILKDKKTRSLTLDYLRGDKKIAIPGKRRAIYRLSERGESKAERGNYLKVKGASANNLKDLNIEIPLRRFVAVTGVSGSGKSSLVYDVLYKALANRFYRSGWKEIGFKDITGVEYINRVVNIDQSAIGRTPRSNPATYVGAWTYIRDLFASTEDARVRGYKPGRFSFNTPGGRCENCQGHGTIAIEMHFLPTVYVPCDVCKGKRFDRETLEVEYKKKNIYDVLQMTIEEAEKFFEDIPWLEERLGILEEVGLGYLKLGQSATTLSGGEAQRVKLSSELGRRDTRRTVYLLDEPTTGLHFDDVKKLLEVLQRLVDRGNTVVVIEHNLDVIKSADWVIDLGPEGGERGGEIVAVGTPEQVARKAGSYTGSYLRKTLK
ncbi:MAG: excinuclease ABC subunit UvrA, partial [Patescibacteria group bacterium]